MHDSMDIPVSIDDYIVKGIKRGKRRKNYILMRRAAGVVMCLTLTLFIVAIRVSPVFAAGAARIPGLKYIVELVQYDKGLTSAIDNDYIQHIGKSDEKLGIVFTVEDIIADNSGIIVFYSIENKSTYKNPHVANVNLLDSSGHDMKMTNSVNYSSTEEKIYHGKIDFFTITENENKIQLPDSLILNVKIEIESSAANEKTAHQLSSIPSDVQYERDGFKVLDGTWAVPIIIDQTKFSDMVKEYNINKTVQVENQKITFEGIKIYPTKSVVYVRFDKKNTMRLFAFDDLKLIDEDGQEWGRITSGLVGSSSDENSQTLNFQSNYFNNPKELYVTGSSIRALDKDKCYFMLDTESRKIIYSPFNLLTLTNITLNKDNLFFEAKLKVETVDSKFGYSVGYEASDSNGKQLDITSSGTGSGKDENINYLSYNLKLTPDFKGPITFKISDYPNRIKEDFRVEIPLGK